MIVKCIDDSGKGIPLDKRENFCSEFTQFGVDIGKEYTVFGIIFFNKKNARLDYLLSDELGYPLFVPSDLFEVRDGKIPPQWHFFEVQSKTQALRVWGYEALSSFSHYQGLVEREQVDIEKFQKARKALTEAND